MKLTITAIVLAIVLIFGAKWWSTSPENKQLDEPLAQAGTEEADVLSRNGLHSHPTLEIYVDEEKQDIPGNIGVGPQNAKAPTFDPGMQMTAMHTHETDGTIHLEFQKIVTKDDVKLKNFFSIWGKDFMEFGDSVTMTVNGNESSELAEYEMKDDDQIILKYSKE